MIEKQNKETYSNPHIVFHKTFLSLIIISCCSVTFTHCNHVSNQFFYNIMKACNSLIIWFAILLILTVMSRAVPLDHMEWVSTELEQLITMDPSTTPELSIEPSTESESEEWGFPSLESPTTSATASIAQIPILPSLASVTSASASASPTIPTSATAFESATVSISSSPSTSMFLSPFPVSISASSSTSISPYLSPTIPASLSPTASITPSMSGAPPISTCGDTISVKFSADDSVSQWAYHDIDGGLEWRSGDATTDVDAPGTGVICFEMTATRSTSYYFTAVTHAANHTEHNDVWIRFSGGMMLRNNDVTSPMDEPRQFFKAYQNDGAATIANMIFTVDHDPHNLQTEPLQNGSKYEVCMSGRSSQFTVYELVFVSCEGDDCHPDSAHISEAMWKRNTSCV